MRTLLLCHGKEYEKKKKEPCFTSIVGSKNAVFLDKDPSCRPHILHDIRRPLKAGKFDLITTMCCDTDAFYSLENKKLEDQAFVNIASALRPGGLFIMPKYFWMNSRVMKEIGKHLRKTGTFKTDYDTFFVFSKHIKQPRVS